MSDITHDSFYIICYFGGDKSKLAVAEISESCRHEKSDYSLASRNEFVDIDKANEYCLELAKKHGLIVIEDGNEFLD